MNPNHSGAARNLFQALLFVAAASATVSAAPTLFIQPVSSSGTHTIVGNQIQIPVGGVEVAFDIRAYGWGPVSGIQNIGAVQAKMDNTSYLGANATPPNPSVDLIPKGYVPWMNEEDRALGAYQITDVCSISNRRCGPGQPSCAQDEGICIPNPDFIFSCCGSLNYMFTATLAYEFGSVSSNFSLGPIDPGPAGLHVGRLVLEIPAEAFGLYAIKLNPLDDFSSLVRVNSSPVSTVELPALLSIAGACTADADCNNGNFCDGVEVCNVTTGDCEPGSPPCAIPTPHCNELAGTCDGCAGDADCPDDGLFCNGVESCDLDNYECANSGNPCSAAQSCSESTDQCNPLSVVSVQLIPRGNEEPYSGTTCPSIVDGASITVFGGACDVELDLRAANWGRPPVDAPLCAIEGTVNAQTYLGVNAVPTSPGFNLIPKGYAPPDPSGGMRSLGAFHITNVCLENGRDCSPGLPPCLAEEGLCIRNPDLAIECCGIATSLSTDNLYYYYALLSSLGQCAVDPGESKSFGRLILEIPGDVRATYSVDFLHSSSFTSLAGPPDSPSFFIPIEAFVPARITVTNSPVPAIQDSNSKNRYISFSPPGGAYLGAFRVEKTTLPTGGCWVGTPDANGNARCGTAPVFRLWDEPVVNVGDCEIVPAATYTIRATADGTVFTDPLMVKTTPTPSSNNKLWGDVAGAISFGEWSQPDGFANVQDILAVLAYITSAAVKPTFQQANLQSISSVDPCLNNFVNTADVLILVKAVAGDAYPFTTDPANCPVCP